MRTYTPLFNEVVDSSLWKEPLHVRIVFVTLMALKDWDHVVRLPIHKIANKANVGDKLFLEAMEVLKSPDRMCKLPQPHDGKRIEETPDGWLILNGEYYQKLMQEMNNRARWAKQKRDQRAKKPKHPKEKRVGVTPGEAAYCAADERGDEKACDRIATPRSAPVQPQDNNE